jgi:hypothetical protein
MAWPVDDFFRPKRAEGKIDIGGMSCSVDDAPEGFPSRNGNTVISTKIHEPDEVTLPATRNSEPLAFELFVVLLVGDPRQPFLSARLLSLTEDFS